jgi:outer membrane protein OmpA-like peptidoglycan-associated protein
VHHARPAGQLLTSNPASEQRVDEGLRSISVDRLQFQPHTTTLTDDGNAALNSIVELVKANPGVPLEFRLSTFSETTPGQNHSLSVTQSEALEEMLAQRGADISAVAVNGLGSPESNPAVAPRNAVLLDATEPLAVGSTADLSFVDATSTLLPAAAPVLDRIADQLTLNPIASLKLVVYASTGAGGETDHALSHERGDHIVEELRSRGVSRRRMSVVGLGATPIGVDRSNAVSAVVGDGARLAVALANVDMDPVNFALHTTTLTEPGVAILNEVAEVLTKYPTGLVMVACHTFTEPSSDANHGLSHRQAAVIVDYLVEHGVDPQRIATQGHGDPVHFEHETTGSYVTVSPL